MKDDQAGCVSLGRGGYLCRCSDAFDYAQEGDKPMESGIREYIPGVADMSDRLEDAVNAPCEDAVEYVDGAGPEEAREEIDRTDWMIWRYRLPVGEDTDREGEPNVSRICGRCGSEVCRTCGGSTPSPSHCSNPYHLRKAGYTIKDGKVSTPSVGDAALRAMAYEMWSTLWVEGGEACYFCKQRACVDDCRYRAALATDPGL